MVTNKLYYVDILKNGTPTGDVCIVTAKNEKGAMYKAIYHLMSEGIINEYDYDLEIINYTNQDVIKVINLK